MKNLTLLLAGTLALAACGKDAANTAQAPKPAPKADNSAVNTRDKDGALPTPADQKNNDADLKTTQEIRKLVVGAGLSTNAENVKIVAVNGRVTLRGPVKSQAEKDQINALACQIAGEANVDNQLEIDPGK